MKFVPSCKVKRGLTSGCVRKKREGRIGSFGFLNPKACAGFAWLLDGRSNVMSCTIQGQIHHFLKFWNLRWFPKLPILSIWHLLLVFFDVFIQPTLSKKTVLRSEYFVFP